MAAKSTLLRLSSPVTDIPGIGPAKARLLKNLGITYIRDFLFTFPRKYEDFSKTTPIAELELGQQRTVHGYIKSAKGVRGFRGRRRLYRTFAEIEDETGVMNVMWFNLPFIEKELRIGREIYVAGTVELYKGKRTASNIQFSMRSPSLEFADRGSERMHTAGITPIYPETKGVTSRFLRYQIKRLLPLLAHIPEYIPTEIIEKYQLLGIHEALRAIHFPNSDEEREKAEERLRFDELFFLQLAALVRRQHIHHLEAVSIKASKKKQSIFIKNLPFSLTGAQERAVNEVLQDMQHVFPMNRLLQGDVGSGKSVIALMAAYATLESGYKVIYLAPTEILARQQAEYFMKHLGKEKVHLLVGATSNAQKEAIKGDLAGKNAVCVVGTHALLQEDVIGRQVGLVIVDEQHRFGVSQRSTLLAASEREQGFRPHLLSMTATPIPRTLNLTVYGDLDVSILDEMPPGRKLIQTSVIPPDEREVVIIHVLEELHRGRQAYVIAPLVEESDRIALKSAKATYEEMRKIFPGIAVGLVHGQMKSEEKEGVMRNFAAGAIQLLVSTSVVEVGVNVPNATMMIIEGAERFGLAQLHQLRGRVGRGEHQSYCYLFPTTDAASRSERLHVLANTNDGFKIAEEDLRLRGPGEIYGLSQSGFGNMKVASLLDYPTIQKARQEADSILKSDPDLESHPILQAKVRQKNMQTHFE